MESSKQRTNRQAWRVLLGLLACACIVLRGVHGPLLLSLDDHSFSALGAAESEPDCVHPQGDTPHGHGQDGEDEDQHPAEEHLEQAVDALAAPSFGHGPLACVPAAYTLHPPCAVPTGFVARDDTDPRPPPALSAASPRAPPTAS
ncbi:MAG: hypothetical protein GY711_21315 [bacterium]|nr:hypothetical protein [bacterium]